MNKITRKGDSKVNPKVSAGLDGKNAQSRMAVRGSLNPNFRNPELGRVDDNLGGNDQVLGGVASYPDVRRIIPRRLKISCVGYCLGFQDHRLSPGD
nr:hypothetical protein [Tanacetum cinerariifolium]